MNPEPPPPAIACRVLSLDGGGAKGFYTLGILFEALLGGPPLYERFDLGFRNQHGGIIAALVAFGHSVVGIHALYKGTSRQ